MKNIIKKILLQEGRVEDMKKKYPEHSEVIDYLTTNDPSNNNKYLQWMMKQVVNNGEEHRFVLTLVKHFHKNIQKLTKKDINQYKTVSILQDELSKIKETKPKDDLDGEYVKLYETENILVVKPLTHKASCKYGSGTKWCITMRDTDKYWDMYTKKTSNFAGTNWYKVVDEVVEDVEQTWLEKLRGKPVETIKKEVKEFVEEFPTRIVYFVLIKRRPDGHTWDDDIKANIPNYRNANPKHKMNKLALVYQPDRADFGDTRWFEESNHGRDMFNNIGHRLDAAHNNLEIYDATDKKVTLKEVGDSLGKQFAVALTHTEHDFQKERDAIVNTFLPQVIDKVFPLPGDKGSKEPTSWITASDKKLHKVDPTKLTKNDKGGVSWSGGKKYN